MVFLIGVFLLFGGICLIYVVGRRRFYRRNFSGLEQFRSYHAGIWIRLMEKAVKLLGWVLVLLGVSLVLLGWFGAG